MSFNCRAMSHCLPSAQGFAKELLMAGVCEVLSLPSRKWFGVSGLSWSDDSGICVSVLELMIFSAFMKI